MDNKKCYGILMVRQLVDFDIFVLKPKYVISGTIEAIEGALRFVDKMGGHYFLSDDADTIFYDVETTVAYAITEDELKSKYCDYSISEASAKYFQEVCNSVHCYSIDSVTEDKIKIVALDLRELIAQKSKGLEITPEKDDKNSVSKLLEKVNGDDIVALSLENLQQIINLGSYEEIKQSLQQIYDETVELNNYFMHENSSAKVDIKSYRILNGNNIIQLFEFVCSEAQTLKKLEEIRNLFKSAESIWHNLITTLETRGGENEDDWRAANDFLYRLIDCFHDIGKLNDIDVIKCEIKELKEKETSNINQTAKIYDKYREIFESQKVKNDLSIKTSISTKNANEFNAREMKQFLDKKVVGQEEAKKDVISAIVMNGLSDDPNDRTSCLLIGPTGSGKTLIISTISRYLNKPFEIIDSTQLSVPGYAGANIEDKLSSLIEKAGGDVKWAEEGIITFDEIDKKGTEKNKDVSGRGVLNTLLSFMQGTTYQVKYNDNVINFDTSKLTVFATGAFTEVAKQLSTGGGSYKSTSIGFVTTQSCHSVEDIKYPELTIQDLVKYGNMPEELLGRFSTITQLTGHTKESLREILIDNESSPLLAEQKKLLKIGVQLKWTEGFIDAVVEQALKLQTGGRSLKSAVEKAIKEARWVSLEKIGHYSCIILGAQTVEDHLNCTLIDKNGQSHVLKDLIDSQIPLDKVKQKSALV